jgi:hypothetical protein
LSRSISFLASARWLRPSRHAEQRLGLKEPSDPSIEAKAPDSAAVDRLWTHRSGDTDVQAALEQPQPAKRP